MLAEIPTITAGNTEIKRNEVLKQSYNDCFGERTKGIEVIVDMSLTISGEQQKKCFGTSLDVKHIDNIKYKLYSVSQHDKKRCQPNVVQSNCNCST